MVSTKKISFTDKELEIELKFDHAPEDIKNAEQVGYLYQVDEHVKAWHGIESCFYFRTDRSDAWERAKLDKKRMPREAVVAALKFYETMTTYWTERGNSQKVVHFMAETEKAKRELESWELFI